MDCLFKPNNEAPYRGFKKLNRRLRQMSQALWSHDFSDEVTLKASIQSLYSEPEEVQFYTKVQKAGLQKSEYEALEKCHELLNSKCSSVCVLGCGTGRELYAIKKIWPMAQYLGIDQSPTMIEVALSNIEDSKIQFTTNPLSDCQQKFNLIWVTALLECHMQSRKQRLELFEQIRSHLSLGGVAVFTPMVRQLHPRSLLFWSSQFMRLRWQFSSFQWEKGDCLVANLGNHRVFHRLVYLHHYPTRNHFKKELQDSGFRQFLSLPQDSWIVS